MQGVKVGVGALVFVGLVCAPAAAQGIPYQNGRVVGAEREGEGPSQIFTFAPDGSDRKQLTSSGGNYQPSWSRDGKRILFSSNHEIWVMNADGGEKRQLTFNTLGGNFTPVESPDGKHIAFSGVRGHTPPEVYVMNADGTGQERLTVTPSDLPKVAHTNTEPLTVIETVPPKVRKIGKELPAWIQNANTKEKAAEATALAQRMQGQIEARNFEEVGKTADSILKLMGVSPEAVVKDAQDAPPPVKSVSLHPTWSPDGKRLAYSSSRSGSMEIWVMNADGSGQTQLTKGLGRRFPDANVPCWSFDGKLITFWAGHEHKYGDVWVMEPDGKNPRRITHTEVPANSDDPHWSPDGTKIIYSGGPPGKRDTYVVDVKTGTVTPFAKDIHWCDWQPISEQLKQDGKSTATPTDSAKAVRQRVAAKVECVKEGARKWEASGRDPSAIAKTMKEKVGPLFQEGKFIEAEAELDRVLEQLAQDGKSTATPTALTEAAHQRIAAKAERVHEGLQTWAASGRDPSAIVKTLQETIKPLLEAGKFIEAEAELDRVLEQLNKEVNAQADKGTIPSSPSPGPAASPGGMRLTEPAPLDFNDHEGYVSLFDGVSLKDWDGHPKFWRVENGAIIGESTAQNPSGNQYLVYRGLEAKDFTLKFEIKVDGKGATGFQYRSKTGIPWLHPISPVVTASAGPVNLNWMMTGPQADFWPTEVYTGQFYSENTPMRIVAWRGQVVESYGLARKRLLGNLGDRQALGEWVKKVDWNQCTVIARGGTCIHIVNGQVMAVITDDDPASSNNQSGLFGIEIESITKLYVKNIWVKKLN